jgi:hypothetical protein
MLKIAKQRSNVKLNTINMLFLVDLRARSAIRVKPYTINYR